MLPVLLAAIGSMLGPCGRTTAMLVKHCGHLHKLRMMAKLRGDVGKVMLTGAMAKLAKYQADPEPKSKPAEQTPLQIADKPAGQSTALAVGGFKGAGEVGEEEGEEGVMLGHAAAIGRLPHVRPPNQVVLEPREGFGVLGWIFFLVVAPGIIARVSRQGRVRLFATLLLRSGARAVKTSCDSPAWESSLIEVRAARRVSRRRPRRPRSSSRW